MILTPFVATKDVDATTTDPPKVVTLDAFGKLLGWFGPFVKKEETLRPVTFVDRIIAAVNCPFFFGYIERDEAEAKLTGKEIGTFLVRLSTTKHGQFTISKVSKSGAVNHQRFDFRYGRLLSPYNSVIVSDVYMPVCLSSI